jgi:hypothetical protein
MLRARMAGHQVIRDAESLGRPSLIPVDRAAYLVDNLSLPDDILTSFVQESLQV